MSTGKHIDIICIAAAAIMLIITVLYMFGDSLGILIPDRRMKYENTLFDTSYVHQIDIIIDDFDSFSKKCTNEEYSVCSAVIDGKQYSNIAIRVKGNASLSIVKKIKSMRYSFKLEFDHFDNWKTLDGLDKLCLNNLVYDNTMMKDFLVYQMMNDFEVNSPLCSYSYLTINGEEWGLYLAVEGIEDSFLARNYGTESGNLYKPNNMNIGNRNIKTGDTKNSNDKSNGSENDTDMIISPKEKQNNFPNAKQINHGMFGRMKTEDVKLKYIDDNIDSYFNIFNNAKTDIDDSDKKRLINSLKKLNSYDELNKVLDIDKVLRYFVVHNFVCNDDSYTGNTIHNYYLHENDGRLSMIPWDYNLAFGTFENGSALKSVNTSIDASGQKFSSDDRPMFGWIFSDDAYTDMYHEFFNKFINKWFTNGELEKLIKDTADLIEPYVKKDPTKFCSTEKFKKGIAAVTSYTALRSEAVKRQLNGDYTRVDTGSLILSDMGTMSGVNTYKKSE